MDTADPAGEFLRVTERYRQMSDDELLVLMPQISDLTPLAQQALASEARQRGLKLEDQPPPTPPPTRPPAPPRAKPPVYREPSLSTAPSDDNPDVDDADEDPYEEDRELVEIRQVWSLRDALKLQSILDTAGIPFFIGPEEATSADAVTSDFTKGVAVRIMRVGIPWAAQAMQHYWPADEPPDEPEDEIKEIPIRCPQCHSEEVVLEEVVPEPAATENPSSKFRWTCDACGNQWEDDGLVKEG